MCVYVSMCVSVCVRVCVCVCVCVCTLILCVFLDLRTPRIPEALTTQSTLSLYGKSCWSSVFRDSYTSANFSECMIVHMCVCVLCIRVAGSNINNNATLDYRPTAVLDSLHYTKHPLTITHTYNTIPHNKAQHTCVTHIFIGYIQRCKQLYKTIHKISVISQN